MLGILQIGHVQRQMARNEAIANFNKDLSLRFWASKHGGVYVPVTDETQPNPFLSHIPDRDIKTPSGKVLTLMNPAYILRQTMKEYTNLYGVRGHITSLKYFRPETAPDEWEKFALKEFERGSDEVSEFTEIDGKSYFRFMSPLETTKECLKCHRHQGYKVGDILGGVSVSVPMATYLANQRRGVVTYASSFSILWLLGIIGIGLASRGLKHRIKERDMAEAELQKTYDTTELKVEERTAELKRTNERLTREIEERIRAEKALQESEVKYRSFVKNFQGIAFQGDMDFKPHFLHGAVEAITGYMEDELLAGKLRWDQIIHPDDLPKITENAEKLRSIPDYSMEREYRILQKEGQIRWIREMIQNVCDKSGEPILVQGAIYDTTEQKQVEEALLAAHNDLEQRVEERTADLSAANNQLKVEIKDRKRAEETIRQSNSMLDSLSHAQSQFISEADPRVLFDELLKDLLSLTQSKYGFIGEVHFLPDGDPYLKTHAISNIAWNKETREFYEKNAPAGLEFRSLQTLFDAVLRTGKPVIANDPSNDPRSGGLPEGHPPLDAFLALPFYRGKTLVSIFPLVAPGSLTCPGS